MKRIPRPIGLTLLAQQTRNQPQSPETIQAILQYMLSHNLQIQGKKLTLESLASYLHIPTTRVIKAYLEYQGKLSRIMFGNKQETQGALYFQAFQKILEDKALVSGQVEVLMKAQRGSYKPYITGALNDILATNLSATRPLLDLAKAFDSGAKSGPNIQINNTNQSVSAIKAIGINEAMQILHNEGLTKVTYQEEDYKDIKAQHLIESQPEVRANYMAASQTDGATLIAGPKIAKKIPKTHIDRRADSEGLNKEELL